ncbi:MAG TPA: SpoIIE family protein phosphatase, partial [Coriobacteriia bacterium]|nr:SpoIIE family protein phosphatase [Coriobacteriia bacterium]
VLATKSQRSFIMTSSPDSGPERHWEVLFVPDLTDGRLDGIIAVGFDVSDLIEAQEQVADSERMYRSIGELLPFGTWTANEDGALTYVSDSFAEMTGRDTESLLGWGWLDLLPSDEDRKRAASTWHHTLTNSDIRDTKHVVRSGDGSYRHLLCRGVRLSAGREGSARWAGIHVDVTDTERQLRFRDALGVVKDMLVKSLDTEELLAQVGEAVLEPTSADFAAVVVPTNGEWHVRYAAGEYAAMGGESRIPKERMPLMVLAFDTGKMQVVTDALNDPRVNAEKAREDGLRSIAALPIRRNGLCICVLALAYTNSSIVADAPLMHFFSDLLDSLDLALQSASVHEHQRHIAETLQESLLAVPEHLPHVQFAHLYEAAAEEERVGGDFYDAFELRGRIAFLIGDIAGSGLEAAALTALSKNTIRAHLIDGQTPGAALGKTNVVMHSFTEAHEFATVFVGILDPRSGRLQYACAGHPPPIVVGPRGARTVGGGGMLLGAFGDSRYDDYDDRLSAGDTMVLYTDGITEARAGSVLYGENRLAAFLASLTDAEPEALLTQVLEQARSFASGDLDDDVALLAIKPVRMRDAEHEAQSRLEFED